MLTQTKTIKLPFSTKLCGEKLKICERGILCSPLPARIPTYVKNRTTSKISNNIYLYANEKKKNKKTETNRRKSKCSVPCVDQMLRNQPYIHFYVHLTNDENSNSEHRSLRIPIRWHSLRDCCYMWVFCFWIWTRLYKFDRRYSVCLITRKCVNIQILYIETGEESREPRAEIVALFIQIVEMFKYYIFTFHVFTLVSCICIYRFTPKQWTSAPYRVEHMI